MALLAGRVHVFFDPTGAADAPRVKNNPHESAYSVSFPAGVTGTTDATAVVPTDWTGQFVVSHYLCGSQSTTPSTPETTSVTTQSSSAPGSGSSVPRFEFISGNVLFVGVRAWARTDG